MSQALIYCRVSTEEQAEKGFSLDVQEKLCRDFAERNDYETVGVYRDEGKSGTSLDRPALKDLLERSQQDKTIKAVIVQETDRLARNTKDHLTIRALLQKANVKLISVAQPMLDDSPEGNMIDTILASVNQFQSDINSRKTRKSLQEKFEQGWWPGWAPLGYLNTPIENVGEGQRARKIVTNDPERWDLMRELFKLYLTGNYSAFELSEIMHAKGLQSRTGKKICNSIMVHILRNPFYAGIIRWNEQQRQGNHEPIITLQEHESILDILSAHNFHASRRRVHHFLLMGFLYCNVCGGRYTAELHAKRNIVYYHCNFQGKRGNEKPHTNAGQNIEATAIEEEIEMRFKGMQFSDEYISMIISKAEKHYDAWKGSVETQRRVFLNQKQSLEQKRDIAEEKLLARIISDEDFSRLKTKLVQGLNQIQNQLAGLDTQHESKMNTLREVLRFCGNVYESYREAPYEVKRHYLGLFWEKFLLEDRRIVHAVPTKIFQALLETNKGMISSELLPSSKLLILLQDNKYMASVEALVSEINRLSSVFNHSNRAA